MTELVVVPKEPFGQIYGYGVAEQHGDTGQRLTMWRKGQKVRYFDADTGEQVGPEHANVAPAVAWAIGNGYFSPDLAEAGIFSTRCDG